MTTWETAQWLRLFQDVLQEGRERQWRALCGLCPCQYVLSKVCICCVLSLYPAAEGPLWHSECVVCWAWSAWPDHWSPRSQCQTGTDSPPPSPCCRDTQQAQHDSFRSGNHFGSDCTTLPHGFIFRAVNTSWKTVCLHSPGEWWPFFAACRGLRLPCPLLAEAPQFLWMEWSAWMRRPQFWQTFEKTKSSRSQC